ncbi:hypothetical protein [Peptoniphilus indolicus]|uniref:Uncharacterized protein n=2 Tax=Peptoniphilus indolicus TaxID=33030 RepID=G4D5F6_9FIRM|nr:hypothetical protein [Peptoniphilus indolicus]EGY79002.1 hypothetical protein HMPREF9129_1636 [Peptoniphilus indolicus ATCC 29427]SUB74374.1 Uncharacterised protein [Peptoniphilus indolicus]
MLSEKFIEDITKYIESRIDSAEMIIDQKKESMEILKTEVKGNMLKVFLNASSGKGHVSDINILDEKKQILISKPDSILKTTGYGLVVAFYIRLQEVEVDDPINIFDLVKENVNE